MTLRASRIKLSPTLGLLRSTLSKNIGVIVLLIIVMLIFCPGILLAGLSTVNHFRAQDYTSPETLNLLFSVTSVFSCIFICLGNYINFTYLYKKSSSDVFHALPLSRLALMFSRAVAAFLTVLIPVTVGYIGLVLLRIRYPVYVIGTIGQIASAYLVNALLMLAFSGLSLIFIICAGSGFDLVVSFCGFNLAVLAIGAIMDDLCGERLIGYAYAYDRFAMILSPIYYLVQCGMLFGEKGYSLTVGSGEVFGILRSIAACFIIAAPLYNFRKAERGGQAYAYRFLYIRCGVVAGICGGYGLSQIFINVADVSEFSEVGFVTFVIGALITTVVYGAVTERGFKNFKRSLITGAISVAVYGVIISVILTGAFGYETRVPALKRVKTATVTMNNVSVEFSDAKPVTDLHEAIIKSGADDIEEDGEATPHSDIDITYDLGGSVMNRHYYADLSKVKNELFAIYTSDERFAGLEKALEAKGDKSVWLNGTCYDDYISIDSRVTEAEVKELISVYRSELNKVGADFFTERVQNDQIYSVTVDIESFGENNAYQYNKYTLRNEYIRITTSSDFAETNRILEAFKIEPDAVIEES